MLPKDYGIKHLKRLLILSILFRFLLALHCSLHLMKNEYSINLPAKYNLKGKERKSWINVINPMRGLLVMGSPGSGKSYFIIQNIIRQHIEKGFSMFIYDFKYDDLTSIAYNHFLRHKQVYKIEP